MKPPNSERRGLAIVAALGALWIWHAGKVSAAYDNGAADTDDGWQEEAARLRAVAAQEALQRQAAVELNVPLRWGGCWRQIADIPPGAAAMEAAVAAYGAARRAAGKKAFTDGPHYELPL